MIQIADKQDHDHDNNKNNDNDNTKRFACNKKQVYPLFNDWFYFVTKVIESNVIFLKYGRDNFFGQILKLDSYNKNKKINIGPDSFI